MDTRKNNCKTDMNYQCPMMCYMCMEPMMQHGLYDMSTMEGYPIEHSFDDQYRCKHDKKHHMHMHMMEQPMVCPMMYMENMPPMMDMALPLEGMQYPMMDMALPMYGMQCPMMDMTSPMEGMKHPMMDMASPMEGMQHPMMDMTSPMEGMQCPMTGMTSPIEGMHQPMDMFPTTEETVYPMMDMIPPTAGMQHQMMNPSLMQGMNHEDMVDVKIKVVNIEELRD